MDGYSRAMLAGAVAPEEATWSALMGLYAACRQYGVPEHLVSDGGGAYTSTAFESVCTRLSIDHRTMTSSAGESWKHLIATHVNIQRRLYDSQCSLAQTPREFERRHDAFIQTYNTTAHFGLLNEAWWPPIPLRVLGEAKGHLYTAAELHHKFIDSLFPRTTNKHGSVALHHDHFHCHDDWRVRKIQDIRDPLFYQTRFASPQGDLMPWGEQQWLVVYRPRRARRKVQRSHPAQQ